MKNLINKIKNNRDKFHNITWLLLDRVVKSAIALLVVAWLARYLGVAEFGLISYATALVAIFLVLGELGLNKIVVQNMVREPDKSAEILLASFFLQVIGSFISLIILVVLVSIIPMDKELGRYVCLLLSLTLIFRPFYVVSYWFESIVKSKYIVRVQLINFSIFSALRVILIIAEADLLTFVWLAVFEAAALAIFMSFVFAKNKTFPLIFNFPRERVFMLLRSSWPLLLSGFSIMLYMRSDQIMLGQLKGSESVGLYTAALKFSEIWYVLPMVIMSTFFPSLVSAKDDNNGQDTHLLKTLLLLMVVLSVGIAIVIGLLSEVLVLTVYGSDYLLSASVLNIHIWAGVFVFVGVVGGSWYISEGLQVFQLYFTIFSALINIALNYFLIIDWGIEGAAVSTLIAQFLSVLVFDFLFKETRPLFYMKWKALSYPVLFFYHAFKKKALGYEKG